MGKKFTISIKHIICNGYNYENSCAHKRQKEKIKTFIEYVYRDEGNETKWGF